MRLELQLGYNDYSEADEPENKYSERFVRLRHSYTF